MDLDKKKLEKVLGLKITDTEIFIRAFTHRSFLNENKSLEINSNERLEFLGDAVLQFYLANICLKPIQKILRGI